MSNYVQASVFPGYEKVSEEWHCSSAIRIPPNSSIVSVGGQTGGSADWKFGTLEEQLTIVFDKLDRALQAAVPEMTSEQLWQCVYNINLFQVGWSPEQGAILQKFIKKYMGDHKCAGTGVGVARLAYPDCLIEIAIQAAVPV